MTDQETLEEYKEKIEKNIIELFNKFNIEGEIEKQYFAKGYREGFIEGFKEGFQKGEQIGMKKAARGMLAKGMNIEEIGEITGLAVEAIEFIKKDEELK